jgi:hypothetical protein
MGTITYDGYWTGTYDQEKHEFRVDTFVAAPTTITFSGESLIPGQQLTDPSLYYFGYADALGEPDLLAAASGNTLPVRMYSNITTLKKGERVPTQAANWPCLLAGTLVATPVGAVPVESLRPGDQVLTPEGDAVTIRWVGRRSAITVFAGPDAVPVVIRAGALTDGVPSTDLCVSQDHAVLIDGLLANARALVNGSSITIAVDPPAQLDYYHLEFDRHRLIVANGAPVESFVDDVSRETFDNVDEWRALSLTPLVADALPFRKVKSVRQLPPHTSERLAERAAQLHPVWA